MLWRRRPPARGYPYPRTARLFHRQGVRPSGWNLLLRAGLGGAGSGRMGVVPMLDALQGEFGVPGVVEFVPGRNGMPTVRLRHPSGAGAEAYLHGAHVTSWTTPAGEELLFVSRQSHFAAGRPIRGGIPVIFPQFGPGALPQHGFARISEWHVRRAGQTDAGVSVTLGLAQTPETLALWPYHFDLEL